MRLPELSWFFDFGVWFWYQYLPCVFSDGGDDVPLAHRAAAAGDMEILTQSIQSDPTILEHQDNDGKDRTCILIHVYLG